MFNTDKLKNATLAQVLIGFIVIGDLWMVDKRYVNENDFAKAKSFESSIQPTAADQQILNDKEVNYRVFNATGYDPSILRSFYEYIDLANGRSPGASILNHDVQVPYLNVFSQATDFLNIKYILVPRAYDSLYGVKTDRFVLLREDIKRDYRLYENKTVLPRFYFLGGNTVTIEKYTPNEIILRTDNPTDATLMSSEVFYPGWEGFIDGKKVDVIKANHAFRALFVPAGPHTVTYRYSPRIFLVGGLISALTFIGCLVWLRR